MNIIKAGVHRARVFSAEMGESKNGTPFVAMLFEKDDENGAIQSITGFLYFSAKSEEFSVKTLGDAFGFDGNFETIDTQLQGKECLITVVEESYEGKVRLKVKWINNVSRRVEPPAKSTLARLSASARRILGPVAHTAPKPAEAPAAASVEDNDDVPF